MGLHAFHFLPASCLHLSGGVDSRAGREGAVSFLDQPDFYGPGGKLRVRQGPSPLERGGHVLRHVADMASSS